MIQPIRQIAFSSRHIKRTRPYWVYMLFGVLLLTLLLIGRDAVGIWKYSQTPSKSCQLQTVLVMGAAQYNGRPSPAFKRRLDKAFDLYEQGCAQDIIVTGGKREGDRFSEGQAGVSYLVSRGIPQAVLKSESQSVSSFENLEFSRSLIAGKDLTIVTDDLHAYRTQYLARQLGYNAELATVFNPYKRFAYGLRELFMLTAYHLGIVR
jgi:uncharacterized SAM-binding protein YcdF (DUF218 family)